MDREQAVRSYETLRRQVLESESCGGHVGLVLLLRQGMLAWMKGQATCATATKDKMRSSQKIAEPQPDRAVHTRMVQVLASMAIASLKEILR